MNWLRLSRVLLGAALLFLAPLAVMGAEGEKDAGRKPYNGPAPPPRQVNPNIPNRTPAPKATEPAGGSEKSNSSSTSQRQSSASESKSAQQGEGKEGEEKPAETPAKGEEKIPAPSVPPPPPSAPQTFGMISAGHDNIMLRLTPEDMPDIQNLDAVEGTEFSTDVRLENRLGKDIDALRVVLEYNPLYVSPVAVNDSTLTPYLGAAAPRAAVDRAHGKIIYEADLGKTMTRLEKPMLSVRWKAVKAVYFLPLVFGADSAKKFSNITFKGESLLGQKDDAADGTLSMTVTVIPSNPDEAMVMQEDPMLYLGSNERVGGAQLEILPPEKSPRVGEVFTMDVALDNRAYSMMDGISMLIEYDPNVLEIIDDDWDNWITLGTNILDGPYRKKYPFDYQMANAVYPVRGQIEYRVGTSTPKDLLGASGTFARIRARALKPSAGTPFKFLFSPRPGSRTTEVTFLGQDVLGDTKVKNDGVRGVMVPILP